MRIIEIAAFVRRETERAIAVADGTMELVIDQRDGREIEREKWFWLPKSKVEIYPDSTIALPERLAADKGLI